MRGPPTECRNSSVMHPSLSSSLSPSLHHNSAGLMGWEVQTSIQHQAPSVFSRSFSVNTQLSSTPSCCPLCLLKQQITSLSLSLFLSIFSPSSFHCRVKSDSLDSTYHAYNSYARMFVLLCVRVRFHIINIGFAIRQTDARS